MIYTTCQNTYQYDIIRQGDKTRVGNTTRGILINI